MTPPPFQDIFREHLPPLLIRHPTPPPPTPHPPTIKHRRTEEYVTNFYDLETFHIHLQKSQFYCLLFLNSGNMKYFISFCYFHFGNFDINFVEIFLKKPFLGQKSFLRKFSKVLLKLFHVTIFKATLDSKMAAIIIFYFEDDIVFGYSHKIPGSIIRCFMTIIEKLSF